MSKKENKSREIPSQDSVNNIDSDAKEKGLIAKKDFEILHNEYHRIIKLGDDLSDVPEEYLSNLKSEGVL